MKKYTIPEIIISSFSVEDIITDSAVTATATASIQSAMAASGIAVTKTESWESMTGTQE